MPTSTRAKRSAPEQQPERTSEKKGKTSKVGNLTRDPELRFTKEQTAVAQCRLAVEEPVVPGEWSGERATTFYDLTVFGEMAEHFCMTATKGMRVVVMGRAELETYKDKEGKTQTAKKILADAIGPDLRWATAVVTKATRPGQSAGSTSEGYYDEEPF